MFIKNQSWNNQLKSEFQKPYFLELMRQVEQEYATTTCFPPKDLIFQCFNYFEPEDTRVVILGQDPYHGKDQAIGLCFGVFLFYMFL